MMTSEGGPHCEDRGRAAGCGHCQKGQYKRELSQLSCHLLGLIPLTTFSI